MQAVTFDSPGEPHEVLGCGDVKLRSPGHGEVRVRMIASPINPSDMMFVRGIYGIKPKCPQSPGFEGVGIVNASGGGLRGRLFRGKRVVVMNSAGGNWAEQAVVPATQIIPIPSGLSDDQAATFFVNPATAWIMTQEVLKIPKGAWLLQTAAGSALGHMIVRLGRHCKFRTLCVVRRPASRESLTRAGADAVVVFDPVTDPPEALYERVRAVTGADDLRYAVDPVGGMTASAVVTCLGERGKMLLFGTLSGQPVEFAPRSLMEADAAISGFWLGNFMMQQGLLFKLKLVRRISGLIQSGVLETEIAHHYSLNQITEAVRGSEDQNVTGKIVLRCS
ncbi:MAG: zinc-dependent alcohol dehydrogenase family protein [Fuerstiella sp.]|nr:zinc-dependent alcohol dehydrogenase family protein [Fuerstiella sp.]